MKKIICIFMIIFMIMSFTACTETPIQEPDISTGEIVVPEPVVEEEKEEEVKTEETPKENDTWYVDTTIVSMLDDINANVEVANSLWLGVNVAVIGHFGGLNDNGFYLISNDMNYAFEFMNCVIETVDDLELDACIVVYGEVVEVNGYNGYTINVEKVEVKE